MALISSYKIGTDEIQIYQDGGKTTYALNGIAVVLRTRDLLHLHTAATIQCGPVYMCNMVQVINHAIIDAAEWKRTQGLTTGLQAPLNALLSSELAQVLAESGQRIEGAVDVCSELSRRGHELTLEQGKKVFQVYSETYGAG